MTLHRAAVRGILQRNAQRRLRFPPPDVTSKLGSRLVIADERLGESGANRLTGVPPSLLFLDFDL